MKDEDEVDSRASFIEALALAKKIEKKRSESLFHLVSTLAEGYAPYPKQRQWLDNSNRLKVLFGGNRVGKTRTGCFETTCHLTGLYPPWWTGIRFSKAPTIWICGESVTRVRDTMQAMLLGGINKLGTGMIPKSLVMWDDIVKKTNVPQAFDIVPVKHVSGGIATLQFFSYDQGVDKFMGSPIDLGWLDEEPPEAINNEMKMRVLDTNGYLVYTFTPMSGVTPLYNTFVTDETIFKVFLSWDDVGHLNESAKTELVRGFSDAEIQARKYGIAIVGTGKIFNFEEADYVCDDFKVPPHWPQIGGLDIGLTHPTAAVRIRYDEESDIAYVTHEYRIAGKTPVEHAAHLAPWKCRFSLSKDAWNLNAVTKKTTASIYTDLGVDVFMCDMKKGSVDASIHEIRARIAAGRFYIFSSCIGCLEEMRSYRANNSGNIVKMNDDLMSAIRYAIMKLDKAELPRRPIAHDLKLPTYTRVSAYEGS